MEEVERMKRTSQYWIPKETLTMTYAEPSANCISKLLNHETYHTLIFRKLP